MSTGELTCERDRVPTRLTCVQCATAICPRCLVRTPVGLKCPVCGEAAAVSQKAATRRMRWIGAAVLGAVVLALVGLPRLLSGSDEPVGDRELIGPGGTTGEEGRARFAFLGEEARDGNLTFVVSGSDCTVNRIEGSVVRVPQGRFCVVSMTLRNDGRAPAEFSAARQALVDRQNRRYAADPLATLVHPANTDRNLIMLLVNPGNQAQVVLVFDVPPDADPDAIALRASDRGPGAFVRLRPPR